MSVIQYNENLAIISRYEAIKIFYLSLLRGIWILCKQLVLMVLRSSKFECNNIDNPPSCLVDNTLGQHSYMKIKGRGIKLHYIEAGDKSKPIVLLLHGFPDCWIGWYNQIPILSEHFRVIALDLKGFGDSDKPLSRRSYKPEILLDELTIFISSLGVTRCAIVGHDLGALLGWYLVHLNPNLVSKFVSISCIHPNIYWNEIPKNATFNNNWIQLCQLPIIPELDALKNDLVLIDQCYKHLKEQSNGEKYIEAYKYTFSRKEDWTGPLNYYRNLPFYRLEGENLLRIDVRCLLINGKTDESVPLETIVKSTEYVEKYYLKIIEDAGHYPHQENPEMVNKALVEFLSDTPIFRLKKEINPNPGILSKMMGSVSNSLKYGSNMISTVKNDPNVVMASLLSKNLDFRSKSS
uniref:Epoxide hydrolase n=1 Tax=Kerria lacca TaxID=473130 RepID=A0AAU6QEK5_9HEMI